MAVASAGPYASLHLAPDRQPHQHPTTLFFTGQMPFLLPNQQRHSTEGKEMYMRMQQYVEGRVAEERRELKRDRVLLYCSLTILRFVAYLQNKRDCDWWRLGKVLFKVGKWQLHLYWLSHLSRHVLDTPRVTQSRDFVIQKRPKIT